MGAAKLHPTFVVRDVLKEYHDDPKKSNMAAQREKHGDLVGIGR